MGKVVVVVEPDGKFFIPKDGELEGIKQELQKALGQDATVIVSPLGVHLRVITVE